MQIFEYPYIIITLFVLCFIVIATIGVYFAIKGVKTASGKDEKAFTNISKLESSYEKAGVLRENRTILYICVDLDNFCSLYTEIGAKEIFDESKAVLLECFSDENNSLISPYADKGFVVFTKWRVENVQQIAESCHEEIHKCFLKHGALNLAEMRIGSYIAFGTEVHFEEAINRAKQAFMLAETENIPYAEWNITSGKALEDKIKIENNIEREIENNRFFLEYQPVLDAKTKQIVGAEVLSRLNSESDGVLSPGRFLSAVDSVGINDKFDYYIFEKNCKWISNDKEQRGKYKYTVNFSRSTLCEPDFPRKIIFIVENYELDFACLAIEVLEDKNITGQARKQMIDNLVALKEKGMDILLDDFGSGYTTFGDLQNLDISVVKIDKSITRNSVTEAGYIILKNIISTAKGIGLKTLCEGVETKEEEDTVIKAGCDMLQGYYYYRPMSVSMLEKLFEQNSGGI